MKLKKSWQKTSNALLTIGVCLFLIISIFPIGHNIIAYLETRHPKTTPETLKQAKAIIVLGGAINTIKSERYQQTITDLHGNRIITTLELIKKLPQTTAYFTGGNGALHEMGNQTTEADIAKFFFDTILDSQNSSRIVYEKNAKNTYENAFFLTNKVTDQTATTLLVTTAYHIPRSLAVFEHQGWTDIHPYPSGYYTKGEYRYWPDFKIYWNLKLFHLASHELIGLIAYELTGKISLFHKES